MKKIIKILLTCMSICPSAMANGLAGTPEEYFETPSEQTAANDSVGNRKPVSTYSEGEEQSFFTGSIPPSPQAAALARYAEYPVSHTTGIPDITIPIYEIKLGDFILPISISYHASGARPDEIPTCVGLGWTLNAGGAITRTIIGGPDITTTDCSHGDYSYYRK